MGIWDFIGVLVLLAVGVSISMVIHLKPGFLHLYSRKPSRANGRLPSADWIALWPDSWIAIKSRKLSAVQAALSLHHPKPCSWLEGFTSADKLFIAPPVKGWILLTGTGLPSPSRDVDICFRFILDLSRKLGEVQFFSACHASQHHAWVKARHGRIVRAYAWADTTLWLQGAPTQEEAELGLQFFDPAEFFPGAAVALAQVIATNVNKVPLLAARWGLDPVSVQQHFPQDEHGVTGQAAHRY